MKEVINRVAQMEEATNRMNAANEALQASLEEWRKARTAFQEVHKYYYSQEWRDDVELSNQGKLPSDLPQGVLSEDWIYDVMGSNHFLALELIDAAMKLELYREDEQ
ncbi:DUF4298 domain-containing protein [uncultured Porphyromonas sp.]|uniref:DUF4298 domain-containing protein n=1 Tax=uncultured Porphyromonas sp. TaxID=159274 RepID=UPI00258597AE|nr:DUF4298 domain-containing protein [uncultured Porphyromonas sp.]